MSEHLDLVANMRAHTGDAAPQLGLHADKLEAAAAVFHGETRGMSIREFYAVHSAARDAYLRAVRAEAEKAFKRD